MINDLEKHTTFETPDIEYRFDNKVDVLKKLKVIEKEIANLIYDKLKAESFIQDYSLNKDKFEVFEIIEFKDNYGLITKKLNDLIKNNDNVILTWFSGQHTLLTDSKTFIENWDCFFYPSSDDLIVINETWNWIIYFAHFESFQFGQIKQC